MGLFVNFRGFDEMDRRLKALADAEPLRKSIARDTYKRGLRILEVATRLVPVDTGVLRGSGFVQIPEIAGDRVSTTIAFGGPAAPYAFIVHEDLDAFHQVGQAKYLEEPFLAEQDGMLEDFRKATIEFVREQMAGRRAA